MGFLDNLKNIISGKQSKGKYLGGFSKTNSLLGKKLRELSLDSSLTQDEFIEKLMVVLIEADIGYKTATTICNYVNRKAKNSFKAGSVDLIDYVLEAFKDIYYREDEFGIVYNDNGPTVILVVGVNGSGKTTSVAKLANLYKDGGYKVCLAAADTFRAGAVEQLIKWGERIEVPVIAGKENQDPSSVLVDAARYAKENNIEILICDTAGRLQNKTNLMNELAKMKRVLNKEIENAPHNTWMVLDANTGQNGLSQATLFNESTKLDGIILTKTDGTSKGGIVIAIKDQLSIPVKMIGFGEDIKDFDFFDFDMYLYSIIGEPNEV